MNRHFENSKSEFALLIIAQTFIERSGPSLRQKTPLRFAGVVLNLKKLMQEYLTK